MKKEVELLEIRRQSIHLIFGVFLATLLFLDIADKFFFIWLFLLTLSFCFFSKTNEIPIFSNFLKVFERKKDFEKFPGKGLLFFVIGSTIVVMLFPKDIAVASILILAFGDSVSHIFGRHFGKIKTPFHNRKHIEGSIFGVIVSTIAASFFVQFIPALLASTLAMIVEFPTINFGKVKIDDNILIPFVAGMVLYLLQ